MTNTNEQRTDVPDVWKVDREDDRALFTVHATRDGRRALCGVSLIGRTPQGCINSGMCRRCARALEKLAKERR